MKTLRSPKSSTSKNSRVDRIAESIREFISSEKLKAGDRLPGELEIAQRMQVSRPVLREAISRLESVGLLEVRRGSGTYVADRDHLGSCIDFVRSALAISPSDLVQYAEMRTAIECAAARLAAERATAEGMAELTDLCAAMDRPELPYIDSVKTDFEFHRKIVELSGNVLMLNLTEVLHRHILTGMVHTTPRKRDHAVSRRLHEAILHAIRDGKADEAEAAMKRHMTNVMNRLQFGIRDDEQPG